MDDWTYPYPNPDVDSPASQPMLLDVVWGAVEARLLEGHAEVAAQAEADRRASDLEPSGVWDSVDDGRNALDVLLPLATPPGAAPAF